MARRSATAVIIRRGPSRWTHLIRWDTERDEFEYGQWFRGRVYERRCDLSPDGSLFIYFAQNGQWQSEVRGSWTAISKPPYFTAVALWPKGDCWGGGGLFRDDGTVWVNHPDGEPLPGKEPRRLRVEVSGGRGEDFPVYFERLRRDGWVRIDDSVASHRHASSRWERPASRNWRLVKRAIATISNPIRGLGCHYDEHSLVSEATGAEVRIPEAYWADIDQHNRLVFARRGKLYSASLNDTGFVERELADFNDLKPQPKPSPASARMW